MALLKLDIYQVRNILKESIIPSPCINFIYGANASGKSAILEAIFILGRAKSFRCTSIKSVINFQHNSLTVSGQNQQANGSYCHLGVQIDSAKYEIRINQEAAKNRSDLVYRLPLQLIHPKSYELLDAGPQIRREFLDWGAFNDNYKFILAWRRFKKALLQRNALLKAKELKYINVWDKELCYYGTMVDHYRQQYLHKFKPVFFKILTKFMAVDCVDLKLLPGWDNSKEFQNALNDDLSKDSRYGFTHSGPHRGDFQLTINNRLAKDFVSRGQLKLLIICLKLAQVQLIINEQGNNGCILIDDFAAELDRQSRIKLLDCLSNMQTQVFITGTELTEFGDLQQFKNYKMFHMEHGHIQPV